MKFETNSDYNYLLCAVFNRPMEECNSVEPPNRGFMSLLIWEQLTGKQAEKNRKYFTENKDKINAQRRAKYRRDKNGTNN